MTGLTSAYLFSLLLVPFLLSQLPLLNYLLGYRNPVQSMLGIVFLKTSRICMVPYNLTLLLLVLFYSHKHLLFPHSHHNVKISMHEKVAVPSISYL